MKRVNEATIHLIGRGLDASGTSISTICVVHCALTPAVVTLLPILGLGFLADKKAEFCLLLLSMSLGIASVGFGYPLHRSWRAAAVLFFGLSFLLCGRVIEAFREGWVGVVLMICGGLLVAGSHVINRRLCRLAFRHPLANSDTEGSSSFLGS